MARQSVLPIVRRIAVLAGGSAALALLLTADLHPIGWAIVGLPTAGALLFYAVGRESRLDPLVSETTTGPVGRLARLALGVGLLYLVLAVHDVPLTAVVFWGCVVASWPCSCSSEYWSFSD